MKHIFIILIRVYQIIPGPWHSMCRHIPTCSNYGIEAIDKYGAIKGSWMTIKRIIRCNPLGSSGYDPVEKGVKNEKNN